MKQDENNKTNLCSDEVLLRFLVPPASRPTAFSLRQAHDEAGAECPRSDQYVKLVLGAVTQQEAEDLLCHAASCDRCGQLLAGNLHTIDGNPSQQETEAIAELAAQKDWQRGLTRTLAEAPARRASLLPGTQRKVWLMAGGLAAGLAALASLGLWQIQRNTPEHQLAMAYTRERTLELRIPDAGFSNVLTGTHTRGAVDNQESSPLLEARTKVARELEHNPDSAHWLDLKARADLLDEHYDAAIQVLDKLILLGPVTAEMLTDAASAYYQRGLVSGSEIDRSTALDYLRRADMMAPTDPVILFNEAIVMEDRGQVMNAVEVWNRYITVERDEKWKAEGKRKLAALEQTLNRLKTHQSRLMQMLATPEAMDALANDPQKLAEWDEELSSMQLDKLIPIAFPTTADSKSLTQARGSPPPPAPCPASCSAARRLLKALTASLQTEHHDFWLTDLLPPDLNSIPSPSAETYAEAMRALAQATREDQTGLPTKGAALALKAQKLFQSLKPRHASAPWLASASRVGTMRSDVEYLFALQRSVDFKGCRAFAVAFHAGMPAKSSLGRYPWMDSVAAMTEKVCDDNPGTPRSNSLLGSALHLAQSSQYRFLITRAEIRKADDFQVIGEVEETERTTLRVLHELFSVDAPAIRIANTVPYMEDAESDSPRTHMLELAQSEGAGWFHLAGDPFLALADEINLARTEIHIGSFAKSEAMIDQAEGQVGSLDSTGSASGLLTEVHIFLANAMLERGDLAGSRRYMALAERKLGHYSDSWGLKAYASAAGLLALKAGDLNTASNTLEAQIQASEATNLPSTDPTSAGESAQLDHDLYAELAATWLAQGRSSEEVLALWERFRLRSRGLPISFCSKQALDCDKDRLATARGRLGTSVVVGQIVLLDRILTYRMDRDNIHWSQKPAQRQDLLDAVASLRQVVSSPYSSLQLTEQLGSRISDTLLPTLPNTNADALMLEPDPLLRDLPWPVLPTPAGPLGLAYPIAELRSILATSNQRTRPDGGESHELIVGASVASQGEPPLPEALDEARVVGRFANAPELLLGNRATTWKVASAIDSATLFHFAGHAVQTERGTELLLASMSPGDRSPWIDSEFFRLHPPRSCRLAVLSACATGKQQAAGTSPLGDMVETLQSFGVPDVVATRWQIDSRAAVPFMDAFYTGISQGRNVAMALSEARRLQSRRSSENSPYYWAAYYVTEQEKSRSERGPNGKKQVSAKIN